MKGPSCASPRAGLAGLAGLAGRVGLALAVVAVLAGTPRLAYAQVDPRRALDPFEPAERGSAWFANESLDMEGALRPSLGYVLAFARRSYVVPGANGGPDRAPVEDLAFLHLGGSLVVLGRVRFAADLPLQLYATGDGAVDDGARVPSPAKDGGVGDLRLGVDARVFGDVRGPITGALGVRVWLPTGQKSQWTSDGSLRAQPRAMLAGRWGALVWAAQAGVVAREGSELTASASAGVVLRDSVVLGPEVLGRTSLTDVLSARASPVEALFGAHWLIDGTARVGGGLGCGLTDGIGAPSWRALLSVEWAPALPVVKKPRPLGPRDRGYEPPPDEDHDGIPDGEDACPRVLGIRTGDPRTNGCPPDADGDGIDDLDDACPTVPGRATDDPATRGCPEGDRDHDGVPDELDACPDDAGPADPDPRRSGCPLAFVHDARIELREPMAFEGATATLAKSSANEELLTAVLSVVLKLAESRALRVEGHSDDRGEPGELRRLSAARAAAVARWLVEHGIDARRLASAGFGADRPIATNETEAGRATNRRIELHVDP